MDRVALSHKFVRHRVVPAVAMDSADTTARIVGKPSVSVGLVDPSADSLPWREGHNVSSGDAMM